MTEALKLGAGAITLMRNGFDGELGEGKRCKKGASTIQTGRG
jgi:hypothetical protein